MRRIIVAGGESNFDNLRIRIAQQLASVFEPNSLNQVRICKADMRKLSLKAPGADTGHLGDFSNRWDLFIEVRWQHQFKRVDNSVLGGSVFAVVRQWPYFVRAPGEAEI